MSLRHAVHVTTFAVVCVSSALVAQSPRDTLRTTTRALQVRDGFSHFDWWVEPGTQPDTYHMNFPLAGGQVTFVADRDSLTVTVLPGQHRDFIVRLRDSISVLTRVSATSPYPSARILTGDSTAVQVIPFTLRDNRIYVEGTINGSAPLLMQFDLGAGGLNFNKHSIGKAPGIPWNATDLLVNSDGRNTVPSSRHTTVRIGAMEWIDQPVVQTGNMKGYEDAIFGNSLFRDRVVEIDYDRLQLRIHAETPTAPPGYVRHALALDNGVRPLIQAELPVDGRLIREWYLFDTGHSGTLLLSARQNRDHQLQSKLGARFGFGGRRMFRATGFRIGTLAFPKAMAVLQVNTNVDDGNKYGVIGNAWLRRLNVILDNRMGAIWLAPTRATQAEMARP